MRTDGEWAIKFIENLTLCNEASGKPFILRDWQKEVVRKIFARKPDGSYVYSRVFCFWPRGMAKTQLCAAIVLARLLGTQEKGISIYSCGKNQKQASLLFNRCAQMVRSDKYLAKLVDVSDYYKKLRIADRFSEYTALASDTSGGSIHGLTPQTVIVDEYHSIQSRDYFAALETSLGKRRDSQMIIISTAGSYGSQCHDEVIWAKKVAADPSLDPSYYPSLYYLDDDAPCLCGKHQFGYECEEQWKRITPALGDFKHIDPMRQMFRQAQDNPAKMMEFRKFHLNQFLSDTESFFNMDRWKECGRLEVLPDDFLDVPVWGGLDLGAVSDFTSLVLITKTKDGGLKALPYFWLPKDRLPELEQQTKAPLKSWADKGFIHLTPGNVTDFDFLREEINRLATKYNVVKIGVDPHNATQICVQLDKDGVPLEFFRQGYVSMNSPCKELQRLVAAGQCYHGDNPVLTWMAGNALATFDTNSNVKIDRKDRTRKVDGIVSLAEAIGVAGLCQPKKSVYESRGALVI